MEAWFKCVMLMLLIAGVMFGMNNDASGAPIEANLWWGQEYGEFTGLLGEFSGAEIYAPCYFSNPNELKWMAPELRWEDSSYDSFERSIGIGIRGGFAHAEIGAGVNWTNYNDQYLATKAYGLITVYYPGLDARLYVDLEPADYNPYGRVSISADWLGRPIGLRGSYTGNITPSGEYKELRGDFSLYLGYPCRICWKSEYDCDLRAYFGGKVARFANPYERWVIDWIGVFTGLRLRMPYATAFIEYQVLLQNDPWDPPRLIGKFVWGMSTSFRGLRALNDLDS